MSACTGAHQQYNDSAHCLAVCAVFPVGAASDASGNTLGCRSSEASAAQAAPEVHCGRAGPGGAGVCGADCDGYCQLAMTFCSPPYVDAGAIYTSSADCQATCGQFPDDAGYSVTDLYLLATGQVACLLYHAQETPLTPEHCYGDLAKDPANHHLSVTCNDGPDAGP